MSQLSSKALLADALAEWDKWSKARDQSVPFNEVLTHRAQALELIVAAARLVTADEPCALLERYRSYEHIEAQHGETGRMWMGPRYKLPVGYHEVSNESGVTDEEWSARPTPPPPADLSQYIDILPTAVDGEPNAHRLQLRVGVQSFPIGPDYLEDREHAEWYSRLIVIALNNAIQGTASTKSEGQS
jgi:hypothetical protein